MDELIDRVSRAISRAALAVSALGLVAMTAIIGWQVFARYVLNAAPSWTEQAALYLMLWFILFAAAAGVREGFHIRLSLLQDLASPRVRATMAMACELVVLAFGLAMAIGGGELVARTWSHHIPTLGLPRGSAYLPLAGSGALIAFFSAERLWAQARGRTVTPLWS